MPRNGFFFLFMMPVKAAATCDRDPGGEGRPRSDDSSGGNGGESRRGCGAGLRGTSAPPAQAERPLAARRDSSGGGRCQGAGRACAHLTAPARAPARARGHAHPLPSLLRVCPRLHAQPSERARTGTRGGMHTRALAHAPACTCAPARTRLCARAHAPPVCARPRARAARVFSRVPLPISRNSPRNPAPARARSAEPPRGR